MIRKPKNIPTRSGIYLFRRGSKILYIGKAANLKKRALSYFRKNVGAKISRLIQESSLLKFFETGSETEALLKEAELIKKYQPKYNYLMRDDKNYFYAGITQERFPRVFITHRPYKAQSSKLKAQNYNSRLKNNYLGPFTSGAALQTTLKLLRRVFPYCTCKKAHKRPCLNSEMRRCPGYCCTSKVNRKELMANYNDYRENIKNIKEVLGGRKKRLMTQLKKEMKRAADLQEFEKAAKLRNQILGLENIFSHHLTHIPHQRDSTPENWDKIVRTLNMILGRKRKILRVEGYDISNISGQEATGSMVVFIKGVADKSEYRQFRIKTVRRADDVGMLKEVIKRRLRHPEWPLPDLMLIDGGRGQLNAAAAALRSFQFSKFASSVNSRATPVESKDIYFRLNFQKPKPKMAALAKKEEELYTADHSRPIKLSALPRELSNFLKQVRDEAHRFSQKYHHKLREIKYRENK